MKTLALSFLILFSLPQLLLAEEEMTSDSSAALCTDEVMKVRETKLAELKDSYSTTLSSLRAEKTASLFSAFSVPTFKEKLRRLRGIEMMSQRDRGQAYEKYLAERTSIEQVAQKKITECALLKESYIPLAKDSTEVKE